MINGFDWNALVIIMLAVFIVYMYIKDFKARNKMNNFNDEDVEVITIDDFMEELKSLISEAKREKEELKELLDNYYNSNEDDDNDELFIFLQIQRETMIKLKEENNEKALLKLIDNYIEDSENMEKIKEFNNKFYKESEK